MQNAGANTLIHPNVDSFFSLDTSTKSIMLKRFLYFLTFLLAISTDATLAAPPSAPTRVCIEHLEGIECAATSSSGNSISTSQTNANGTFPGTNLKFYPGFVVYTATTDPSPASLEKKWQELYTSVPNRKASYRPPGVYGGIAYRPNWRSFYADTNIRPKNPSDHTDPAYDWSKIDAVFRINAVQNEGALIFLDMINVNVGHPAWIANAPYNGTFNRATPPSTQISLKYYRYSGPDALGRRNVGDAPPIADEVIYFMRALRDHLVATGNIDKVMYVALPEIAISSGAILPSDFDLTNHRHGSGLSIHETAKIWAESGIYVLQLSLSGSTDKLDILWQYMDDPHVGIFYPDMKMLGTNNITSVGRFNDLNDVYQKDVRMLVQGTENNGQSLNTYFASSVPNPWNYKNVTVPQTTSHILWALSGPAKGENKDSGLGQKGDDPSGLMPAHSIVLSWDIPHHLNSPTIDEIHEAIDTFGPPGTFAFPYLPPGYIPNVK